MMTVEITGTPTLDSVITVADLKTHLRVDHSDEDTLIEAYRDAAIKWIEDHCNTRLGDVTAVGYLDYFKPSRFPIGPISAISSVTYLDTSNSTQTLDTSKYWYDIKTNAARITFDQVPDTYDDAYHRVQINMTLGYAEADIPKPILTAVRWMVAHMYEQRQPVVAGTTVAELPIGLYAILNPYRIITTS